MCLAYNANRAATGCRGRECNNFVGQGERLLAQEHNCCAWVETSFFYENDIYPADEQFDFCGTTFTPGMMGGRRGGNRETCCVRNQ